MVKLSCQKTINHAPKKGVVTHMITYHQMTLADIFTETQEIFEADKPEFLKLLETTIDLSEFITVSFRNHFYASTGRPRGYSLTSLLWALIIQRLFSIPTDSLLLTILKYSKELREFCGFTKIPDASKITRFKQEFIDDLQVFFDALVDLTEPILQQIDADKASMSVFDTTGLEAYVTENNPKYANQKIRQLKTWAKIKGLDSSFDPYKAAYGSMPAHACANSEIKQQYLNGHFCYAYKAGVLTNGLGIIRAIEFYDKDYFADHPEIELYKKTDAPDEDKAVGDARLVLPLLKDFFRKHPLIDPKTFLGDAAFDSIDIYKSLLSGDTFGHTKDGSPRIFEKAYIPLNGRAETKTDYTVNAQGIPCCPHDPALPMRPEGNTSHLRCGLKTFKFVCPKMKWDKCEDGKYRRVCHCDDPCTDSSCGRMIYIYPEKDLRLYPGVIRGTEEWESTYKIRTSVERSINHFKDSFCLGDRKTQNAKTLHADLLLAGITQLITVVVADRLHKRECIRSLKRLIG